jgi:benzylsuccinate CoA-transferase BbsF subunit
VEAQAPPTAMPELQWQPKRDGLGPSSRALSSIRVCDFSGQLAGAGATRVLGALGAQIIRVEDPVRQGSWDILRGSMPWRGDIRGIDSSGAFNNHNIEKLGITLNVRDKRGLDLAYRLIAESDVVTENFATGVFARLGFSWEKLHEINPRLVYVSNCGFGHTGPYSAYKTWGPIVQALSGITATSGIAGHEPAGWGYSYMDHMGANFMALAVVAGLVARMRTGEGQYIDMSCTEAGLSLTGPLILDYTVNARGYAQAGHPDTNHDEYGQSCPHNIYPARGDDEWIAIACRTDDEWDRLAGVIATDWAQDDSLRTLAVRRERQSELDERIGAWSGEQDKFQLNQQLRAAGVPAAPVLKPPERADDDERNQEWGMWPTVQHPVIGEIRVDGMPMHLSESDWVIQRPAPRFGQHTEEVLVGLLGVSPAELATLSKDGVV